MTKFKITSLFFLIFLTLFLFFYNENTKKKIEDLNGLENLIFQNGNLIANKGSLEEYIAQVVTDKTIRNYEILNNRTSLLVSIESEKISVLLNILYNIERYSIFRVSELNIIKKNFYEMNFTVENL